MSIWLALIHIKQINFIFIQLIVCCLFSLTYLTVTLKTNRVFHQIVSTAFVLI